MTTTETILQLIKQLVEIKSISSNVAELTKITDFASSYMPSEKVDIRREIFNGFPNLIITPKAPAPTNAPKLLLNAHLDVVPADDTLFTFAINDNKAFGRGVFDMKGAAAATIQVFKDLLDAGQIKNNIILTLVTDEEIGGYNGVRALLQEKHLTCDFFLAGEPTDLNICTKQKGVLWLEITQPGKAAHGSRVWEGKNANITLAQHITDFYRKHPVPTAETDTTTYNCSLTEGGTGKNIVAESATAFFDIRRNATDDPEKIIADFKSIFSDCEIKIILNEPILDTDDKNQIVHKLQTIVKKHAAKAGAITHEHFASDGRFYSATGVPAVNFGLIGGGMHQRDEWIDIKSIEPYYQILRKFILTF